MNSIFIVQLCVDDFYYQFLFDAAESIFIHLSPEKGLFGPRLCLRSSVSYIPFVLGGQDHLLFEEVLKVYTGDRSPRSTTMIISSTFNDQDYREYSVTKFD